MTVQIVRVVDRLPADIGRLVAEATAEGVGNVRTVADGWADGLRFGSDEEALFAAFWKGTLAGIGAVTLCPDLPPASRMRRFYVGPAFRRAGVGSALAGAAMQEGLSRGRVLTCNARATAAAPPFWEAMGFEPIDVAGITHIYRVA